MKVQDYVAEQTERVADSLAHFIDSTLPERRDWQPPVEGEGQTRSALQQVGECVALNEVVAKLFRGEEIPAGFPVDRTFASSEEAKELLRAGAKELADAIRALTDEDLEREFKHPRAIILGKNLILMPLRNMTYHSGQINLIQMLYGDSQFHVPPKWR